MKKAFGSLLRKMSGHRSGNAAMLVTLGLPALLGGGGLAVDVTQWYIWKRELQFAVDQAAIAGAWARADAVTRLEYETRAGQEFDSSLQVTKDFASEPTVALVNYDGGSNNAVRVTASAEQTLPFTGIFMNGDVEVAVQATATLTAGASYSGCIVALHPTMEGAFTLGGNASGTVACGVAALSNDEDAAMVKNGNSTAQLGQLVATGGIDADFAVNGTMHPFTAGLTNPFGNTAEPDPSPSPAQTYSCPVASAGTSSTTATVQATTVISYQYHTGNNSNQALTSARNGTNVTTFSPATGGSSTPDAARNNVSVPAATVNGSFPAAPVYTYVRQVSNNPKKHEIKKTVITTTYSNVLTTTTPGSDGIARPEPGTYGTINITCQTEFQPGIYLVDDIDFGQNQVVTGQGVLFVIRQGGGMHINSRSNLTLSGISKEMLMNTYNYTEAEARRLARMVIYDADSTDQLKINGNSDIHFEGILYMPSREVWFNGTSAVTGQCIMVVASQVTFTGTVDLDSFCTPSGSTSLEVGSSEASVKLVA
jgi:Flp pilus assembly protein TadG